MYLSIIEYPKYYWLVAFGYKRLCHERFTAGTFILKLLQMFLLNKSDKIFTES